MSQPALATSSRFNPMPKTQTGRIAVGLTVVAILCVPLGMWRAQSHGTSAHMWDDPVNAVIALLMFASAFGAGVLACFAIIARRERTLLLVLPILAGLIAVFGLVGYALEGISR